MQHPSRAFLAHPVFESLRRWSHGALPTDEIPIETTIEAMDAAGVRLGLICAWWGPRGPLIPNDQVAAFVRKYPDRLAGVAAVVVVGSGFVVAAVVAHYRAGDADRGVCGSSSRGASKPGAGLATLRRYGRVL